MQMHVASSCDILDFATRRPTPRSPLYRATVVIPVLQSQTAAQGLPPSDLQWRERRTRAPMTSANALKLTPMTNCAEAPLSHFVVLPVVCATSASAMRS